MRELIDEEQFRPTRERRVDIELFKHPAAVFDFAPWQKLEPEHEAGRIEPFVRLDPSDDDIEFLLEHQVARNLQHAVRFADARGKTKKYLELAAFGAGFISSALMPLAETMRPRSIGTLSIFVPGALSWTND